MSKSLHTPFGQYNLACSFKKNENIQAWNQADVYLLDTLHQLNITSPCSTINDQYGALSISLGEQCHDIYNDSAIFKDWIAYNWAHDFSAPQIHAIPELGSATAKYFIMKLPKSLAFFKYQLSLLSQLEGVTVFIAGMQKYWPKSFYDTASAFFTSVEVLPGVKKSKLMILKAGKNIAIQDLQIVHCGDFQLNLHNFTNVFSYDHLDIGTRFFIENIPKLNTDTDKSVIDLGCGNGALGINAAMQNNHIDDIYFLDESSLAIKSCQTSFQHNATNNITAHYYHHDCTKQLPVQNADIVLCNPPFHQLHTVSDSTAIAMIKQSQASLGKNGKLFLIGNRHLQYHIPLKKYFSSVSTVAANNKFTLFQAVK